MSEQNKPPKGRVVYGKIAEQFRRAINDDNMRRYAEPKQADEGEPQSRTPGILADPQGAIIHQRMMRFRPAIFRYVQNVSLRLISQDDFLISVRSEGRKLLESVRSMGRLQMTSAQVNECMREILLTLQQMMEGIKREDMDIQMAPPLVDTIMGKIEDFLVSRLDMPDHEKFKEGKTPDSPVRDDDPLAQFPPNIRRIITTRLTMLGINPRDTGALMRLARQLGVEDPEAAMEQLRNGEIPDELKSFF